MGWAPGMGSGVARAYDGWGPKLGISQETRPRFRFQRSLYELQLAGEHPEPWD